MSKRVKSNFVEAMQSLDCPDLDSYISDLKKVTNSIKVLDAVNPTNLDAARTAWFDQLVNHGIFTSPVFEYAPSLSPETIAQKLAQLAELKTDLSNLVPYVPASGRVPEAYLDPYEELGSRYVLAGLIFEQIKRAERRLDFLNILASGHEERLGRASVRAFGYPSPWLSTYARRVMLDDRYPEPEADDRLVDAEKIRECFIYALEFYNLDGLYSVTIVPGIPAIKVSHPTGTIISTGTTTKSTFGKIGTIKIPKDRLVTPDKLKCLVAHEIESHILDNLNAKAIFHGLPRIGSELVSEGHAIMNEELTLERLHSFPHLSPTYLEKTLLVSGINMARAGASFALVAANLYEWLIHHTSTTFDSETLINLVWTNTLRIFRGCRNTVNHHHYAFTKDHAYLSGVENVAFPLYHRGKAPWLSTGLTSLGWLEYLIARFSLSWCDLSYRSYDLALSPELDALIRRK